MKSIMKLPIFKERQVFNPAFEAFCLQNCIQHVLRHYGVKDSIKYVDTSLYFRLVKGEDEDYSYHFELHKNQLHHQYASKVISECYDNADPMEIWLKNKQILDQGTPVVVDMDLYDIAYSGTCGIYHNNHSVILAGYENENPCVIDWYHWKYKGEVELEQYLKARASECPLDMSPFSGRPVRNNWLYLLRDEWKGDWEELMKLTIDQTIHQYYDDTDNMNQSDFHGIYVIRHLRDLLLQTRDRDEQFRSSLMQNIRRASLSIYSQLALLQFYLRNGSRKLSVPQLSNLIEQLAKDIPVWKEFTVFIMKAIHECDEPLYDEVIKQIEELIKIEETRYNLFVELNNVL